MRFGPQQQHNSKPRHPAQGKLEAFKVISCRASKAGHFSRIMPTLDWKESLRVGQVD